MAATDFHRHRVQGVGRRCQPPVQRGRGRFSLPWPASLRLCQRPELPHEGGEGARARSAKRLRCASSLGRSSHSPEDAGKRVTYKLPRAAQARLRPCRWSLSTTQYRRGRNSKPSCSIHLIHYYVLPRQRQPAGWGWPPCGSCGRVLSASGLFPFYFYSRVVSLVASGRLHGPPRPSWLKDLKKERTELLRTHFPPSSQSGELDIAHATGHGKAFPPTSGPPSSRRASQLQQRILPA